MIISRSNKKRKGFTLIELLVVIAIITLLSSVVMSSVGAAKKKARDAIRLATVHELTIALEQYMDVQGRYPNKAELDFNGWDTSSCDNNSDGRYFMDELVDTGLLKKSPRDPLAKAGESCENGYRYIRWLPGDNTCNATRGHYYTLAIFDLEATEGAHPYSPGFSCNAINFQGGVDWVQGKYEN